MVAVMVPNKLIETRASSALLPAIAAISNEKTLGDYSAAIAGVGLCFTVAERSFSSASFVAKRIRDLPDMPSGAHSAYLHAFDAIVGRISISLVGFCSEELLQRFRRGNIEDTLRFVDEGIAVVERYGRVAAEAFIEQKTMAARRAAQVKDSVRPAE
jgi:hypothetical protein